MSSYSELIKTLKKFAPICVNSIFTASRAVTVIRKKAPALMMTSDEELKAGSVTI